MYLVFMKMVKCVLLLLIPVHETTLKWFHPNDVKLFFEQSTTLKLAGSPFEVKFSSHRWGTKK